MMIIIFWFLLNPGFNQIKGSIKGPTVKKSSTSQYVLKYHLPCSFIVITSTFSKNSPQCLHFIASSWISSAQYGHFFIINLLIPNLLIIPETKKPAPSNTIRQLSQPPVKHRLLNFKRFFYRSIFYYYATYGNSKKVNIGLLSHWPWVRVSPGSLSEYHTSLTWSPVSRWGFLFVVW